MTRLGWGAAIVGAATALLGLLAGWRPLAVVGLGIVLLVSGALAYVRFHPRLALERTLERRSVHKGQPAEVAVVVTNRSRRPVGSRPMRQWIGGTETVSRLPRLRPGETALRVHHLPTARRGRFELPPVELPREDPFGLCRGALTLGHAEIVHVHPRIVALRRLPSGASVNVEGPTSDASPQGTVAFHRLREYVVGDDLRTVHWPSSAHAGRLVVRHNVDTAQPYTVVVLDVDAAAYSGESFEEAVDVAASLAVAMCDGGAPVQLRTGAGEAPGGSAADPLSVLDTLTDVAPRTAAPLVAELSRLRSERGGSALAVVTGRIDLATLPSISSMRRRFDRIVVLSVDDRPPRMPVQPGVTVVIGRDADEISARWNAVGVRSTRRAGALR